MKIKDKKDFLNIFYYGENKTKSLITPFFNHDEIYFWTNEVIAKYPKLNLKGKDVLCVTASLDHALHAVLMNAKTIDCFDINEFSKYFAALKKTMIITFKYDEFFNHCNNLTKKNIDKEKIKEINVLFEKIKNELTDEELEFWELYYEFAREYNMNPLFTNSNTLQCYNNLYKSKRSYNKLRRKLPDVNITFKDSDILDIKDNFNKKTYDVIFSSNILSRLDYKTRQEEKENMLVSINDYLKPDGVLLDYVFNASSDIIYTDKTLDLYDIKKHNVFGCEYVNLFKKKH